MKKRVLSLLLLLMACQRDELMVPNQAARARITPDEGDDDQEDPVDEQAELNGFCYALSRQSRFRNRMKLTARLVRTIDSANRAMTPERRHELALTAQWIHNESHNEDDAKWVIRQYGFASAAEVESLVMQIHADDEWYAGYALVQKYGVGRVYEQAHRYLFNPRYRLPSDRPAGQSPTRNSTDPIPPDDDERDDPDDGEPPKDNPGTPFWNEAFGTWTNPPVDIYGHQQPTGWTSQIAYLDYLSSLNQAWGPGSFWYEHVQGNPAIPMTPGTQYAQDQRVAQKQKNCKNIYDAKIDDIQIEATEKLIAAGGLYLTAKGAAIKSRKLTNLPDLGGVLAIVWILRRQESQEKVAQAEYKQCMYDANY